MRDIAKSLAVLALCAVGAGAVELQSLKNSPFSLGAALPAPVGLTAVVGKPASLDLKIEIGPGYGRGHGHRGYVRTVTGGPFRSRWEAKRALNAKVNQLQARGNSVLSANLTRTRYGWGYEISFRSYRRR
mgnify:CR=1 FL=1